MSDTDLDEALSEFMECPSCGNPAPEYLKECPRCGDPKCEKCDMGDAVECLGCIPEAVIGKVDAG